MQYVLEGIAHVGSLSFDGAMIVCGDGIFWRGGRTLGSSHDHLYDSLDLDNETLKSDASHFNCRAHKYFVTLDLA